MMNQAKINELAVKELERQLDEVKNQFLVYHIYLNAPSLYSPQHIPAKTEEILQAAEIIRQLQAEIKFITETGK